MFYIFTVDFWNTFSNDGPTVRKVRRTNPWGGPEQILDSVVNINTRLCKYTDFIKDSDYVRTTIARLLSLRSREKQKSEISAIKSDLLMNIQPTTNESKIQI